MNKIKTNLKVIIGILAVLICVVLIRPWNYFMQSERYIENNVIRKYYKIIDEEMDVDKYNSLVISSRRRENFNNIPDAVEKRDILNVERLYPEENDQVKQLIKEEYDGKEDKVRFYFVEYDIKFKEGVATPVDSGRYCIVMRLEKEHGKWLINDNYSRAVKKNDGTIEIIS
ncbi:MAG: DUF4829 domain-containing protein [Clostridium argentinense]|uniref:DUF4829 domain-containing protein n=1 Tax=Clostridium faecium TaxID=2762223 RepID=A0ABR8YWN8_9CLOT|nr:MULTISPECIES: DUF4829 domain-containing protein [Clostridium]MBD8048356.1 DUF4829 domain-containing protein [Clostridium faecium]MBS5822306.1 DUF4829 domain-containing protein [Clostridium argentinense]MDU1348518.1 DUF4829 domain-containing protein [Clostridium argentinense]